MEGKCHDAIAIAAQHTQQLSAGHVPNVDSVDTTGRGEPSPIGGKSECTVVPVGLVDELVELLAGAGVPEPDRAVLAGRGQPDAVGVERQGEDGARVTAELNEV